MKKYFYFFLLPTVAFGFTKEQLGPIAQNDFETKFGRVQRRLEKEEIDTQKGIAKIYCDLCTVKLEEVFADAHAKKCADELYEEIINAEEYNLIVERLKKAHTEDVFEQISGDYIKFVVSKARDCIAQDCLGIVWVDEGSDPNDREWLMIDYPKFYQLNSEKEFNGNCKSTVMGANAVISLMVQKLYEVKESE